MIIAQFNNETMPKTVAFPLARKDGYKYSVGMQCKSAGGNKFVIVGLRDGWVCALYESGAILLSGLEINNDVEFAAQILKISAELDSTDEGGIFAGLKEKDIEDVTKKIGVRPPVFDLDENNPKGWHDLIDKLNEEMEARK